jgi:hypothetical protein
VRFGIAMAIFLAIFIYARTHYGGQSGPRTPTVATPTASSKHKGKSHAKQEPDVVKPQFQWLLIVVLGSLAVAFVGVAGILVLRRRGQSLPPRPMAVVLSEVLSETLDDLRAEPDPRKAVIGAYARMERTWPPAAYRYLRGAARVPRASSNSSRPVALDPSPDGVFRARAVQPARD